MKPSNNFLDWDQGSEVLLGIVPMTGVRVGVRVSMRSLAKVKLE